MPVILIEDDMGSKERTKKALGRVFDEAGAWKRVWDNYWNKVEQDANMLCKVDTEALKSTIRVIDINQMPSDPFIATGVVMPRKEVYEDTRAIIAGDIGVVNPKTGKPVTYAQAVHDGHISKAGNWVEGDQFLTLAIDMNASYLNKLIDNYIEKELKKFGGK